MDQLKILSEIIPPFRGQVGLDIHYVCSVDDVTEGSTQEAHMCASCVLPRKVDKMGRIFSEVGFEENDVCFLGASYYVG